MHRWVLAALAVLLGLAALSWSVWSTRSSEPMGAPGAATSARTGDVGPAVGSTKLPADADGSGDQAPDERAVVADASADDEPLRVRTVDASTGRPVAGATVLFTRELLSLQGVPADERPLFRRSRLLWLQSRGAPSAVTDAEGRAALDGAHRQQVVVAHAEGLFGNIWAGLEPDEDDELLIRMEPDWTLRVRVLDAADRPVGEARIYGEATLSEPGERPRTDLMGVTDERGIWEQLHAQTHRLLPGDVPLRIRTVAAGALGAPQQVDPRLHRDQQVTLTMPATGEVVVRCEESDGTPVDPTLLDAPQVVLAPTEETWGTPISWQEEVTEAGLARFAHVGLNQQLRAWLDGFGDTVFPGPTRPGETVEVVLRDAGRTPILAGILRLPDGTPLARVELGIEAQSDRTTGEARGSTDADGRFRIRVYEGFADTTATLTFRSRGDVGDSLLWSTTLEPRPIVAGVQDLGVVRVEPAIAVARGRLTGIEEVQPERVRFLVYRAEGERPSRLSPLHQQIEDDGRFELQAIAATGATLQLRVEGPDFVIDEPILFHAGVEDLELPVTRTATVEVGYTADSVHALDAVDVWLVPRDPAGSRKQRGHYRSRDNHRTAVFSRITSGRWDVEFRRGGAKLLAIEDVVLGPDEPPDPRLEDVDLRALLRTVWIRAADGGGRGIEDGGRVHVLLDGDTVATTDFRGGAAPVVLSEPATLWIDVPGHRLLELEEVFEDRSVALETAAEVTVRVELPMPLPGDVGFETRLLPLASLPEPLRRRASLDAGYARWHRMGTDGTVVLPIRAAGPQTLQWRLTRGRRRTGRCQYGQELAAPETGTPSRWTVRPESERIAGRLSELPPR